MCQYPLVPFPLCLMVMITVATTTNRAVSEITWAEMMRWSLVDPLKPHIPEILTVSIHWASNLFYYSHHLASAVALGVQLPPTKQWMLLSRYLHTGTRLVPTS